MCMTLALWEMNLMDCSKPFNFDNGTGGVGESRGVRI